MATAMEEMQPVAAGDSGHLRSSNRRGRGPSGAQEAPVRTHGPLPYSQHVINVFGSTVVVSIPCDFHTGRRTQERNKVEMSLIASTTGTELVAIIVVIVSGQIYNNIGC